MLFLVFIPNDGVKNKAYGNIEINWGYIDSKIKYNFQLVSVLKYKYWRERGVGANKNVLHGARLRALFCTWSGARL